MSPLTFECGRRSAFAGLLAAALSIRLLASIASTVPAPSSQPANADADALLRRGIQPDAEGIGAFLVSLQPTPQAAKAVGALILQLGSDDPKERDAASERLAVAGPAANGALRDASQGDDPEIAARARELLARDSDSLTAVLVVNALHTIRTQRLEGMTGAILDTLPLFPQPTVARAAGEALEESARPQDAPRLWSAVRGGPAPARAVVVRALAKVVPAERNDDFHSLLKDGDEAVRLAAARAVARQGDRAALAPLADLLESRDPAVRGAAHATLHALTGKAIAFNAFAAEADRRAGATAWRQWIEKEAARVVLRAVPAPEEVQLGRTLVCVYSGRTVFELDAAGNEIFRVAGFKYNWGVSGLPNGHRIVCDQGDHLVVEYDENGKECWRFQNASLAPSSAQRLEGGNTLIACMDADQVCEITPGGEVGWSVKLQGSPSGARRLDSGNTLVTLRRANRVVEIDPEGKELWSLANLKAPYVAQRLDDGRTLVCEMDADRIAEYDLDGNAVWTYNKLSNPADVQRLPNGNTMVSDANGVHEIDPEGREVWAHRTTRCRLCRY